ncbi:protein modification by small protein conjugation [Sparganum proliferum]
MANQETQSFEDEVALVRCLPELNSLRMTGELTDVIIELQDDVSLHVHRFNAENIKKYWDLAELLKSEQLMNACLHHIKTNFEATVASDFFIQLPADTVLSILRADDLIVDREESVFKSIGHWVSSPSEVKENRLVHVEAMLREVRWNQVDADFRSRLLNEEGFWNKSCIFAIGGDQDDGSLPNLDKFDTKELRWKECAPLFTERIYHSAVVVPVGQENVICVFGGWNWQYECLDTCEVYSPQEDKTAFSPDRTQWSRCRPPRDAYELESQYY